MDINTLRSVFTVLCLLVFLAIIAWAFSKHNRVRFEAAAQLPFADDDIEGARQSGVNNG